MKIVIFSHPNFITSQSMPRFVTFLAEGLGSRGHQVEIWTAKSKFHNHSPLASLRKWFGYIDQYLLFPAEVRKRLKTCSAETLFVFADNALGPWVPLVADRPHVIHCHDFLAQQSALGKISQNRTSWTGRRYQSFIRAGYTTAKHFISVSKKTQSDLHSLLTRKPVTSEVVYNGLNQQFSALDPGFARRKLGQKVGHDLDHGYLLHVGGNQWYKNRAGVIDLYNTWRNKTTRPIPLLMIGSTPSERLMEALEKSPFRKDIHFLTGLEDQYVQFAYSGASLFLFPSHAEGFGWPIAEAMASGCPVITTGLPPMTEVGGRAAFYLEPPSNFESNYSSWCAAGSRLIQKVLCLPTPDREMVIRMGKHNSARFDASNAIQQIEAIYLKVLDAYPQSVSQQTFLNSYQPIS